METKKNKEEMVLCPVARIFSEMEKTFGNKSKFAEHLKQSQIEFLKAIRSLVDDGIENLEEKKKSGAAKKVTRIKVE